MKKATVAVAIIVIVVALATLMIKESNVRRFVLSRAATIFAPYLINYLPKLSLISNPLYFDEMVQQARRSRQIDYDTIAMIGDSETVGFATSTLSIKSENFGICGDTVEGAANRVRALDLTRVRAVILEIGINDLLANGLRELVSKYPLLIGAIPNEAPIIIMAVMPVGASVPGAWKLPALPASIKAANVEIERLCSRRKNCKFLDISPELADKTGFLAQNYSESDGIHLSTSGYRIWDTALQANLK